MFWKILNTQAKFAKSPGSNLNSGFLNLSSVGFINQSTSLTRLRLMSDFRRPYKSFAVPVLA